MTSKIRPKKVIKYPSEKLVTQVDLTAEVTQEDIDVTLATLESIPGAAALAANQIGITKNFFVVSEKTAEENRMPRVFINPVILDLYSHEGEPELEGCLSFPGLKIPKKRFKEYKISFNETIDGSRNVVEFEGFAARVVQHEMEHLSGKTFIDSLPEKERREIWKAFAKMKGGMR